MTKSNNFLQEEKKNNFNNKTNKERLSEALRSNLKKRKIFQKNQKKGNDS